MRKRIELKRIKTSPQEAVEAIESLVRQGYTCYFKDNYRGVRTVGNGMSVTMIKEDDVLFLKALQKLGGKEKADTIPETNSLEISYVNSKGEDVVEKIEGLYVFYTYWNEMCPDWNELVKVGRRAVDDQVELLKQEGLGSYLPEEIPKKSSDLVVQTKEKYFKVREEYIPELMEKLDEQ